jgi:hypothetical protein
MLYSALISASVPRGRSECIRVLTGLDACLTRCQSAIAHAKQQLSLSGQDAHDFVHVNLSDDSTFDYLRCTSARPIALTPTTLSSLDCRQKKRDG